MSAQQHRVKKSGSRSSQAQSQSNGHASQVASSQVDFQQNPHERLGTRQGYRNLKAETVESREQLVQPTAEARAALAQVFREADSLFENVKMPREGVLDSSLFNLATTLVKEQVDRLNSGFRSYDPKAFASEIRKMLSSEAGKLALRQTARHHSLVTNTATFMLGPLDVPIKERRVAQRREKDVITQATTAEDVDDLESDNKNEATKRVEELEALLPDEGQNMNFWEYVYDGDEEKGFGRTIENIFYSAFLARDGHSGLAVDGTSPQIMRTTAPLAQDYIDRIATKHQCVVQFDYTSWMQLREAFGDRTYLPAPTAEIVNEAAAPSKKKATQGGAKAEKKATPAKKNVSASQASVTSPNSKKRSRAQEVEEDDDSEVGETQIEDTPAERLPSAKRKAL